MSAWSVSFAPLFDWTTIAIVAAMAGLFVVFGLGRRLRGSWLRLGAFCLLVLALCNPSLLREDREPLKTVIPVVVDQTDSQKFDGRNDADRRSTCPPQSAD